MAKRWQWSPGMLAVIWSLAWPTMLEQLMQTAVQYIDTAMVGVLGTSATAAVGSTGTVNWLVNSSISALSIGFLSYIARARGAGDERAVKRAVMQVVLTVILVISLPIWKKRDVVVDEKGQEVPVKALTMKEILSIKGAKDIMIAFFCYCALEQTAGLWASSYMVLHKGVPEVVAASYASMFFIGITIGRFFSGFLTMKLNDKQMIRLGMGILAVGVVVLFLPLSEYVSLAGFVLIGVGCAPIYPCIIHSTPEIFGADKSQAIVGVQMASAYMGSLLMPTLFGIIANHITVALLPMFLCVIFVVMVVMYERLVRVTR